MYWIFTACLNRLMFAGGYGSRWSFSKCGHIWKRRCCFAKRGSLATCPTAVGESTRSKGTGVFWEIEILTFPFFFHSKLIREGKTETFTATLRLLMGCLYSWMNEAVMILNATCWCTMGSNHKAFSNLRSYSWWTKMWLTSNLKIFPNWCKVSAINNIKPCDLKLEIVGFFSHPKQVVT